MKRKLLSILLCLCMVLTLTLKGFVRNYTGTSDGLMFKTNLNLVLKGENVINTPNAGSALSGNTSRDLYISGTGSLAATGKVCGISVMGSLTISGGTVTATATGGEATSDSFGTYSKNKITILYNYAVYKGYDVSVGEDTNILSYNAAFDVQEWAIPAMQWACGAHLRKPHF